MKGIVPYSELTKYGLFKVAGSYFLYTFYKRLHIADLRRRRGMTRVSDSWEMAYEKH